MEWFKMYPAKFRAREFIGSDPVERATWLAVMCYCVEQENSGRLVGAALWKDRQWQQTCGVTLREVSKSTKLIKIEGDDVIIWEYPIETQDEIKSRRKASVIANGARWGKKSESVTDNNSYSVTESRVEKSREEKNTPPCPPASDLPKTLEEAISRGRAGGVSPDFCREVFLEHEGTSWTFAGKPVTRWESYIKSRFIGQQGRAAERAHNFQSARKHQSTTYRRPEPRLPSEPTPAWVDTLMEIRSLLPNSSTNLTQLASLARDLPASAWSMLSIDEKNELNQILKGKK
jgi:hypothetical protein